MPDTAKTLDLRGLKCPLPVLKTEKAMKALASGEFLAVETTDPLAAIDIPAYCQEKGHLLTEKNEFEDFTRFVLQKAAAN